MHYEVYVDSLFLVNFMMNLYLLLLVDRTAFRVAKPLRLLAGAAVGAAASLLPFLGTLPAALRFFLGTVAGTAGMLCLAFPVRGFRMFLKLLEKLLLYSFGLGGGMLFLVRCFPGIRRILTGVVGILGMGGLLFLFFGRLRSGPESGNSLCKAVLCQNGRRAEVTALVDSGNSLMEPVSGKPACIVDREVFDRFWEGDRDVFRAIPYHSIGKRRGILRGYLLPRLELELDGMRYVFDDVYLAVSEEGISGTEGTGAESVNMIMNPGLFAESAGGRERRQNERHNDSESDNTGENTI